jgi:hypothetical protein
MGAVACGRATLRCERALEAPLARGSRGGGAHVEAPQPVEDSRGGRTGVVAARSQLLVQRAVGNMRQPGRLQPAGVGGRLPGGAGDGVVFCDHPLNCNGHSQPEEQPLRRVHLASSGSSARQRSPGQRLGLRYRNNGVRTGEGPYRAGCLTGRCGLARTGRCRARKVQPSLQVNVALGTRRHCTEALDGARTARGFPLAGRQASGQVGQVAGRQAGRGRQAGTPRTTTGVTGASLCCCLCLAPPPLAPSPVHQLRRWAPAAGTGPGCTLLQPRLRQHVHVLGSSHQRRCSGLPHCSPGNTARTPGHTQPRATQLVAQTGRWANGCYRPASSPLLGW